MAWFPGAYDLRALSWAHVRVWGAAGSYHRPPQKMGQPQKLKNVQKFVFEREVACRPGSSIIKLLPQAHTCTCACEHARIHEMALTTLHRRRCARERMYVPVSDSPAERH
jgi:hypothetical protein